MEPVSYTHLDVYKRQTDKVTPRREWVDQIAEFCAENEIPVFYKDNLRAYFPDLPPSAFPWEV